MATDKICDQVRDIGLALMGNADECDVGKAAFIAGQLYAWLGNAENNRESLADQLALMTEERNDYAEAALAGLGGIVGTPEKGYVKDGGPGQLRADFRELRKEVARLEGEIERLKTDRSNLRKALQQIADYPLAGGECRTWASDALEGWVPSSESPEAPRS